MKNKVFLFLLLIISCISLCLTKNIPLLSVESDILGFELIPVGVVVLVEAFVSIHMSLFFLLPLAKIINQRKSFLIFGILFFIRLVLLVIGDILIPSVTVVVDFMAVFLGAFIIVPIAKGIKSIIFKNSSSFNEYDEADYSKLSQIGFSDGELLKKALVQQYLDVKNTVCDLNYNKLLELCSSHQYMLYKNEMKLLEKARSKNVIKDFDISDVKIYDAYKDDKRVEVFLVLRGKCIEYTVDSNNKVIRGKDKKKKNVMIELSFINNVGGNIIEECPNCAAPITDGNIETCSYCGTSLNYKIGDWALSREHRVYEK